LSESLAAHVCGQEGRSRWQRGNDTRIRRLINRISSGLDELEPEQRQQLQQAVTVVRRHRSVMLGMPRTRQPLPDLRPERTP
jgi:hypothetical protein